MAMFGSLWVPEELLAKEYALDLLGRYFRRDEDGYVYSGAVFDTYPAGPASGIAAPGDAANVVTDSDLVALSLLGIRVTGYEALIITQDRAQEIAPDTSTRWRTPAHWCGTAPVRSRQWRGGTHWRALP